MIIKTLMEDTALYSNYKCEHGLSLYIETLKHKILFDTGASDLFLENAKTLNVDIEDIDLVILSHGHYDHSGGLKAFLEKNSKAKVYIHNKAFEKHYSEKPNGETKYIGIDPSIKNNNRLIFTKKNLIIDDELELFSGVTGKDGFSSCNNSLFMESENGLINDTFEHEQNLIINQNGNLTLIAGCAHNGIINILNHFTKLKGFSPKYVFGGFHLFNYSTNKSEDLNTVSTISNFLNQTETIYYTGHCTGLPPFTKLKEDMKDKIHYFAAGSVVEI